MDLALPRFWLSLLLAVWRSFLAGPQEEPPHFVKGLPGPARPGPCKKPALAAARAVVDLPAPVTDVAVGGAGRFLVLRLAGRRQLALFDAAEARVVHTIPAAGDHVRFTASMDRLVVFTGTALERWNLLTRKKEASTPLAVGGRLVGLGMGSASNGPLLVGIADEGNPRRPSQVPPTRWQFHDLKTLREL